MNQFVLGADIGGTHITAALVDLSSRTILSDTVIRRAVDANASAQAIITAWSNAMQQANKGHVAKRAGIAMPGPFDYENGISLMQNQDKYDALYGVNVKESLAKALQLETQHIRFQNDAPCFLKGEAFAGAAKGYHRAIGLTLGTGLGSTALVEDKAWDADLWRTPFLGGIAEEYLSSRWFVKRFRELSGKEVVGVKGIVALFPAEPSVQVLFDEFALNLAAFLSEFARQEKPEVIVLGGNISKAYVLFGGALQEKMLELGLTIPIKTAERGEEAALLGASSLWLNEA